jgi:hypothetical protein
MLKVDDSEMVSLGNVRVYAVDDGERLGLTSEGLSARKHPALFNPGFA